MPYLYKSVRLNEDDDDGDEEALAEKLTELSGEGWDIVKWEYVPEANDDHAHWLIMCRRLKMEPETETLL